MAFGINKKESGFALIGILCMMILLAVTATALNRQAGLRMRMAANQTQAVRTDFGREAAGQEALWRLAQDPSWRTDASGEDYVYDGITYNRKVLDCSVAGYTDAVTVSIKLLEGLRTMRSSIRYIIYPPEGVLQDVAPYRAVTDTWNDIYYADNINHRVFKYDISTGKTTVVAGNGTSGYDGDGGPATEAMLNGPMGVAFDSFGNLYIADTINHCVRKVDSVTGTISTVAGTGAVGGFAGDEGAATQALLNTPTDVAVDPSDNLYIADKNNHCIRKVDITGTITTVAGVGGSSGDAGDGGPATEARLFFPQGIHVDHASVLFIADTFNHRVKKVNLTTGVIYIVAGSGSVGYAGDDGDAVQASCKAPEDVFTDNAGNVYIADTKNYCIRKVDGSTGIIDTVAGTGTSSGYAGDGGPATDALMTGATGIWINGSDELVISDYGNRVLRIVDSGGAIDSLAIPRGLGLLLPRGMDLDSNGNLYIADTGNHRVRKLDNLGYVSTVAGTGVSGFSGDGGPAASATFNTPAGVAVDAAGNIYIADLENHCIRKVDTSGIISTAAGQGGSEGFSGDGGLAASARLTEPAGVALDDSGNLYIADTGNHCIRKVDTSGIISTVAGQGANGGFSGDGGPDTSAKLRSPEGITADDSGNLYIADTGNHCIRKVDESGIISTVAGIGDQIGYSGDGGPATSAKMNKPAGVFVDSAGNIFIADRENHRIRVVNVHDGVIKTLAGTGTGGFNGDDQPAVSAWLFMPSGVVMQKILGGAKIYIVDKDNSRIRMLIFKQVNELY